ncbi:cytochrome P450 2U1-like [Littorina saxatilis]|uniref:cytochrome P450 2U1-like n=1 Tax=Littorina saxatilis TaxID=31220 RepID=UPI0038B5C832
MASLYSMEEGDTGVVSDVKIEIDVAEDTPHCCYRTEPLQYVPIRDATENTATMPTVQTTEGQAAVSTHSDTWLKQEIQTPETQTAVSTHSDTWLKQEMQTPETQTAVSTHSDTWLKPGDKKHACTECDAKFTMSGYEIPRDTLVLFNVWGLHHDARYWPHPSRFNPYRFLNEDKVLEIPDHFMPYGAGTRQCPGESLADVQLFLFFTAIMHQLRALTAHPNMTLEGALDHLLRPKPFCVKVEARD